jgi:hypothetical protein
VEEDHKERLITLEVEFRQLKEDVGESKELLRELHKDMLERRAAFCITKLTAKYLAWLIVGIATLLGATKGQDALAWIKDLPR